MLSIILGSLFCSAIAFGISSKVLGYFSSVTYFSSFDSSVQATEQPLSNLGISVFIAVTLPMFIFSDLMGSDLFLYPIIMLLLVVLEHIINEPLLFSTKRIFLQSVILSTFILFADTPFLWNIRVFSSIYVDFILNAIINLLFYLTAIHLLMYLGTREEEFRTYSMVLVGMGSIFFYHTGNKFGLLLSLAIIGVIGYTFIKQKELETKSLSSMFGFMLLVIAMNILRSHSTSTVSLESNSLESVRAVTAIFFSPAHKGAKRILSKALNLNWSSTYSLYTIFILTVVPFVFMTIFTISIYLSLVLMLLVIAFLFMLPEAFRNISANPIRIRRN